MLGQQAGDRPQPKGGVEVPRGGRPTGGCVSTFVPPMSELLVCQTETSQPLGGFIYSSCSLYEKSHFL